MQNIFRIHAAYNVWANEHIFTATEALSDEEFSRDLGLTYRSVCGVLNHVLIADRLWMKRFTAHGEAPMALDSIIHPNLVPLQMARKAEDERIYNWIHSLSEDDLRGRFSYMSISDMRTISERLAPALLQFFNHQTHHRGQVATLLTLFGETVPKLDMLHFQRNVVRKLT